MLKTVLRSLLFVVVAGIAIVLILAARKPDIFQVTRTATINAPPERVYALIADFKAWGAWSPWEKKDPDLKRTYGGSPTGVGATYAWVSDKSLGEGNMRIVDATVPSRVALDLDFIKPFEAHNDVVFSLRPQGPATVVTWTMTGATPFVAKIMHVFVDMDRMLGGEFESGLTAMKAAAERPA